MAIDYQRMQARTTRMLRQNGATYNVTRKGSVTVIGGVEHKNDEVRFTAVGVCRQRFYLLDWQRAWHIPRGPYTCVLLRSCQPEL